MEVLKNFLLIFALFVIAGTAVAVLMIGTLFLFLHWPLLLSAALGALVVANGAPLAGGSILLVGLAGQYVWNRRNAR